MTRKDLPELVLVLGGARSGKSLWALRYVEEKYDSYVFLATARVQDDEMTERVRLHRQSRGPRWALLEEPLEIPRALSDKCSPYECVVVDCLTLWLSNVILEKGRETVPLWKEALLEALAKRREAIVLVSNEVGMGVVPEHPLGRSFRDHAGSLNQDIAKMADRVVFLVAGLPIFIKGA